MIVLVDIRHERFFEVILILLCRLFEEVVNAAQTNQLDQFRKRIMQNLILLFGIGGELRILAGIHRDFLIIGEMLIGNSAKPRVAVGIGVSLNTPGGKFRINFAEPVVRQEGDRSKRFSISFGTAF